MKIGFFRVGQPITDDQTRWSVRAATFEAVDFVKDLANRGHEVLVHSNCDLRHHNVFSAGEWSIIYHDLFIVYAGIGDFSTSFKEELIKHRKRLVIINRDARTLEGQPWFEFLRATRIQYELFSNIDDFSGLACNGCSIKASFEHTELALTDCDCYGKLPTTICFQNIDGESAFAYIEQFLQKPYIRFFGTLSNVESDLKLETFSFRSFVDLKIVSAIKRNSQFGLCFQSVSNSRIGLTLKFFEYIALGLIPLVHESYDQCGHMEKLAPGLREKIVFSDVSSLRQLLIKLGHAEYRQSVIALQKSLLDTTNKLYDNFLKDILGGK